MAYSHGQATRAPISRHPAFVPLCAAWLAALTSGCIAVLPGGLVETSVTQAPLAIPPIAASQAALAAIAGAAGGLVGWMAGKVVAAAQDKGRAEHRAAEPRVFEEEAVVSLTDHEFELESIKTALPLAEPEPVREAHSQEEPVTEEIPVHADVIAEVPEAHENTLRHGKAVNLLRRQATDALAMPQLIERFAVALDDHRSEIEDAAHSYSPPAPPADITERLRALLPHPRPTN